MFGAITCYEILRVLCTCDSSVDIKKFHSQFACLVIDTIKSWFMFKCVVLIFHHVMLLCGVWNSYSRINPMSIFCGKVWKHSATI